MFPPHRHFICARVDGIAGYVERVKRCYPGYLDDNAVSRYFRRTCPQFLVSMGSVMEKGRPINRRTFDKFRSLVRWLRNRPYLCDTELTIDNGGYQVQQGFMTAAEIPAFTQRFYDLITYSALSIDWTFTLDLAPGKVNIFESEAQLTHLNDLSYSLASRLPEAVRSRVIYIEHFRTLELLRVWENLHRKELAGEFFNFGTGGLASSRKRKKPPCIDYVIPLIRALRDARARGLREFRYHVLGASQFQYLLAHSLFERHIREVHGIEVCITCDSTIVFSKFATSYAVPVVDLATSSLHDISLRSVDLNAITPCGMTNLAEFAYNTRVVLEPYGMKALAPEYGLIYRPGPEGDILTPLAYMYGLLLYINNFHVVERWCRSAVERLYPVFLEGRQDLFLTELAAVLSRITESVPTPRRIQTTADMARRILHSLHMLSNLDWDYAKFIVDRYLNPR